MKDFASLSDAELMAMYKTAKDPFEGALKAEGISGPVADIARSIYQQESGSGKNTKTSNAGAVGGMQIIPGTFKSVADKDWDINDPTQNARAGLRYVKQLYEQAGGDPALTAAGYYGGPGGLEKARRGVAVSDPRNPTAPTTLQYGQQVAARIPKEKGMIQRGVEALVPSAEAAQPAKSPLESMSDDELMAMYQKAKAPAVNEPPRVEVRGMSADEPGAMSRLGSGIVKGTKDLAGGLVRGAGSIGATLLAPVDMASDAMAGKGLSLESNRQRRADMDAGLQTLGADTNSLAFGAGKLTGEIAGTAGIGNVLGAGAQAVGAAPKVVNALRSGGMTLGGAPAKTMLEGAGNLALRAGAGAAVGGSSAGLVNPEDAGTGATIGGALPVATKVVGKTGQMIGGAIRGKGMAPEVAQLADRAKQLGIDIPADRLVNSKPLNALASSLEYVPMSGRTGTMNKMEDQLNRAVSRTFGQDTDNVAVALRKAGDDLGSKFEKTLSGNTVKVDKQLMDDLGEVSARATKELPPDLAGIINKQIDDIVAKGGTGEIDGQAAYNIKKTLDNIGRRNSSEAFYAKDLQKTLMGALNRSLGPEESQAFAKVRQQYGNMLALEKLVPNGAEGGVSIAKLANLKNINNKDLQELADISAQFLKTREGPHGAAQRVGVGLGAAGLGFGTGTLPAVATGIAGARGANMLLNSSVLKNAVAGTPQTNALLRYAGDPELLQMFSRAAPVVGANAR